MIDVINDYDLSLFLCR